MAAAAHQAMSGAWPYATAMTTMARMSSAMASVWKKTLVSGEMLSPSSDATPSAKAMSVAMGMAQPLACPPALNSR